jgi:hypothetical protein
MKAAEVYLAGQMKPKTTAQVASSRPAIRVPAAELEKRTGAYRNPKTGTVWQLMVEAGKLLVDASARKFEIVPTAAGIFRAEGIPIAISITFPPATTGSRPRLRAEVAGEKEARLLEPIDLWTPTPAQLAEMAGNFRSEELQTVFVLVSKDNKLFLCHRSTGEEFAPLQPTMEDSFTADGASITFSRDADGKIDGFHLDSGRMKKISFIKQAAD